MKSIRQMERDAARWAALSPEEKATEGARLALARHLFGMDPDVAGPLAGIFAERRRQIEVEGWSPEHDDEHGAGELLQAAWCYLVGGEHDGIYRGRLPRHWPWDAAWWKPRGAHHNLIRAGALCVAEAERLHRAALALDIIAVADLAPVHACLDRVALALLRVGDV